MNKVKQPTEKEYYNGKELSQRWACSTRTILNYRKAGIIRAWRAEGARCWLYPVAEVHKYEADRLCEPKIKNTLYTGSSTQKEWRLN